MYCTCLGFFLGGGGVLLSRAYLSSVVVVVAVVFVFVTRIRYEAISFFFLSKKHNIRSISRNVK